MPRRPAVRAAALLAAAPLTAACSAAAPTEPTPVEFAASEVRTLRGPAPAGVRAEAGRVVVQNVLTTPSPCYEVRANAARGVDRLDVTVTARPLGEAACVSIVGAFAYTAAVPVAPAGRYRLVVRHVLAGSASRADVALDTTVVVP